MPRVPLRYPRAPNGRSASARDPLRFVTTASGELTARTRTMPAHRAMARPRCQASDGKLPMPLDLDPHRTRTDNPARKMTGRSPRFAVAGSGKRNAVPPQRGAAGNWIARHAWDESRRVQSALGLSGKSDASLSERHFRPALEQQEDARRWSLEPVRREIALLRSHARRHCDRPLRFSTKAPLRIGSL